MATPRRILILRIQLRLWSLCGATETHTMQVLDGGGTTPGEEKGENNIEGDFEDGPPHDPAGADVQGQAAAAALLRAQADAQQTAFENQIWAYNDSRATVMAHVQGATTGSSNGEFYDYHGPGGYTPSPCICQAVGDVATLADRATAIIRRRDEGKRARRVESSRISCPPTSPWSTQCWLHC